MQTSDAGTQTSDQADPAVLHRLVLNDERIINDFLSVTVATEVENRSEKAGEADTPGAPSEP